jgi:diguanylate cyclase (GGDEF)-like protein/PAS domain S-box-containing protein
VEQVPRPADFQRAQADLLALLAASPIAFLQTTLTGVVEVANSTMDVLLRYPANSLVGKTLTELLASHEREEHAQLLSQVRATPIGTFGVERTLIRADGGSLSAYLFVAVVTDSEGRPNHLICFVLDRSSRHTAVAALAENEQLLAAAQQIAHLGSFRENLKTGESTWSDELYRLLGTQPGAVRANPGEFYERIDDQDRAKVVDVLASGLDSMQLPDLRIRGLDGQVRTLSSRIRVTHDKRGRPEYVDGSVLDVTETRKLEAQLRNARDLFGGVLDAATEQAILATDANFRITVFNTGAERMFGYAAHEVFGTSPTRFIQPEELAARTTELRLESLPDALTAVARSGRADTRGWNCRAKNGDPLEISLTVNAMHDENGDLTGFIGVATDVTAQRRAEVALRASEERFRLAFDNAPIGMALVSAQGKTSGLILKVNYALCRLSGHSAASLLGTDFRDVIYGLTPHPEPIEVSQLLAGRSAFLRDERRIQHADGHDIWIRLSASLVRDGSGGPNYCVLQIEDITARKHAEERLIHQTLHDALTGLPNRVLLSEHLTAALVRAERNGKHVGLLFVDLDNFKDVNDSLGHDAGDELLVEIAHRLRRTLRDSDTAARLGGDEFVVVCEDLDSPEEAVSVAQRVETALDITIDVRGQPVVVSASLGVATSDGSERAEDMLRNADAAMYMAKEHGRGRYEVFDVDLQARAVRQLSLESELRRALEGDELRLHYQAGFDLASGAIVGVEALLRWEHPERGMLTPADFLDVAEDRRLMIPLGEWVLHTACEQAAAWERVLGRSAPEIWVNISSRQLGRNALNIALRSILADSNLDPRLLCLELTERQMLGATPAVQSDLDAISDPGVTLAVDDFGTGFANIDYLRRVPFRILKMDRSYVGGLGVDRTDTALTAGIVALGHSLDLTVVAEGVETASQQRRLSLLGCDLAQGFLMHRPADGPAVTTLLTEPRLSAMASFEPDVKLPGQASVVREGHPEARVPFVRRGRPKT